MQLFLRCKWRKLKQYMRHYTRNFLYKLGLVEWGSALPSATFHTDIPCNCTNEVIAGNIKYKHIGDKVEVMITFPPSGVKDENYGNRG